MKLIYKSVSYLVALICVVAVCFVCVACGETSQNKTQSVNIGTLQTEDFLPYWVAQDQAYFNEEGIDANIKTFSSATELIAGITSGEVDYAMTDIVVTASIFDKNQNTAIEWVTLGTEADQGRFGIMSNDPSIQTLKDLRNVPIGVGSNTMLEYVMDTLLTQAGLSKEEIVKEEIQKLPVRYQSTLSKQVKASVLPGTLLALGEVEGMRTVADDTKENITQSVMIASDNMLKKSDFEHINTKMKKVWDKAAKEINGNPEKYKGLLCEKANISDKVKDSYKISVYPTCELPKQEWVDNVLAWMKSKGYLSENVKYKAADGTFSK
ncbi:MAG: MetQ/NlpA family ABC transporter substrate-binding protein [Coriobacteriales bacterium]|nr:MetQ/NlpA family ABC transporter substrate-binding protein [Coriobacteriales bacterium]